MIYQMRLPFPRKRTPITCGHPEKPHYSKGMCEACYAADYRKKNLPTRQLTEAKSKAKKKAIRQKARDDERDERLRNSGIRRAISALE